MLLRQKLLLPLYLQSLAQAGAWHGMCTGGVFPRGMVVIFSRVTQELESFAFTCKEQQSNPALCAARGASVSLWVHPVLKCICSFRLRYWMSFYCRLFISSLVYWEVTGASLVQRCCKSLLQQNRGTEQLLRVWSCISVGKLETPAIVLILGVLFGFVKSVRK